MSQFHLPPIPTACLLSIHLKIIHSMFPMFRDEFLTHCSLIYFIILTRPAHLNKSRSSSLCHILNYSINSSLRCNISRALWFITVLTYRHTTITNEWQNCWVFFCIHGQKYIHQNYVILKNILNIFLNQCTFHEFTPCLISVMGFISVY
jgi:hypothetical protein